MKIHTDFELLNQNSNLASLGLDPWIYLFFSLPWSSLVEEQRNLCEKKEEQSWKEKEEWRTIGREREKIVWSWNLYNNFLNLFCTKWSNSLTN